MILACGGPEHFATLSLVKILAGAKTDAEVAALKRAFGGTKTGDHVTWKSEAGHARGRII